MGTRSFSFAPETFFHIYNRGNSKQNIFLDSSDFERFITLLLVSNSKESFKLFFIDNPYELERGERLVSIGAYCLMPNHFHILLTPRIENGVSLFMKKVMTGYVMYFNNRYNRTGSLFEGRFKARLANDDTYLKYLYAYIHLNPAKLLDSNWKNSNLREQESVKAYIREYPYSSFKDYSGEGRKEKEILNPEFFPEYFPNPQNFEKSMYDWFENNQ